MGRLDVRESVRGEEIRAFTQAMLADLEALETMLREGCIESGVTRMGAEQEMALVDHDGRPAGVAMAVLEALDDGRFTTELAVFNMEANLAPMRLEGDFLRRLEADLGDVLQAADRAARGCEASVLLTGIVPTLSGADLDLRSMTPRARYRQLNDALLSLGGGDFPITIRGVDELELRADSVMFEAANTSFQLHLQVSGDDFARLYNLAQLISAPLLASAVNSPLFLGRRLWHETRVALFERSVDARTPAERARGKNPRVSFGNDWLRRSVLELFRDTAVRFPVALVGEADPQPSAELAAGRMPKLSSLLLHNGTVWRWNRPCYGVADGIAHLRIENRVLPAGPTVLDEVANAALFYGLMLGLADESADIPSLLSFDEAKNNFLKASRHGLGAQMTWLGGTRVGVRQLLVETLVPAAREGLASVAVPDADIERYLGVIEARVRGGRTGARWLLDGLAALDDTSPLDARAAAVTRAMLANQRQGAPVHAWPAVDARAGAAPHDRTLLVGDIMSTDVFTVRPQDVVDLATSMMAWKHFRHVPVEAPDGTLLGLVSHRVLLTLLGTDDGADPLSIESVMDRDPLRVSPELPVLDGMRRLLAARRGCLLVVQDERLVGIVTERDFLRAAVAHFDADAALAEERGEAA